MLLYRVFFKRLFDIIFSFIGIILLIPLFIVIPIMIKIDSTGPVFFKQDRLTKNGKIFKMYKFRSMIVNAEKQGAGLFNYEGDPRVTKVGKFLRKTSLDEIPQLFNVLNGTMSIIGPRPPVSYELGDYDKLSDTYKRRFTVLPGITGYAQVIGRNDIEWDEKVELDNIYIDKLKKYGFLIDLKILFLTAINVFKMKNIYEKKNESLNGLSDEEINYIQTKKIHDKSIKK